MLQRSCFTLALLAVLEGSGISLAQQTLYGQCGGMNWAGPKTCASGSSCQVSNSYYSQCLPVKNAAVSTLTTLIKTTKTSAAAVNTIKVTSTRAAVSSAAATGPSSSPSTGKVQYAGINIAGFDFGQYNACGTQSGAAYPPLANVNNGPDGIGQMDHFVKDDGLNAFRLPVTYQWLVNNNYQTNKLDATNFGEYDQLVQGCISSGGKLCIIDMHNYARWNNNIIGQSSSAPTAAQFAAIWGQLAAKYAKTTQVAFGIMNEPNDDCGNTMDVTTWQATVQGAVNAIRQNGATSQYILLPGKHYEHPQTYTGTSGSGNGDTGAAILAITDNGSAVKSKLIIDTHQYLDSDDSGTSATCSTSGVADSSSSGAGLQSLATWLARNGRQAFLSETGGGNNSGCVTYMKQQLGFLNKNSNLFLGYTGWAAGGTSTTGNVYLTPTKNGDGTWTDTLLLSGAIQQCFVQPSTCA